MGNQNCCASRQNDKDRLQPIDKKQLALLVNILRYYSELVPETRGTDTMNLKAFEKLFQEIPQFAIKFFKYCLTTSGSESTVPIIQLTSISIIFENKRQVQPFIQTVKTNMDIFDLFSLVVLEKTSLQQVKSIKEFDRVFITYEQGLQILQVLQTYIDIKLIISMFIVTSHKKIGQLDQRPIKSMVDGIFSNEKSLKYTYFIKEVVKQLSYLNLILKDYFNLKFLQSPFQTMKVPKMLQESYMLSKEWLALFALSHADLYCEDQIELTYSSAKSEFTFDSFASTLIDSGERSIIFLIYEEPQSKQRFAYAGYNRNSWTSQNEDQDFTQEQIIYQLTPHFQVFNNERLRRQNVYDESESPSFFFNFDLKNSEGKVGFGMGRDVYTKNYLFWVDKDIAHQSYCTPFNEGDQEAYLPKPFQLLLIEIWQYGKTNNEIDQPIQRHTVTNQIRQPPQILEIKSERKTWTQTQSMDGSPKQKKNLRVSFKEEKVSQVSQSTHNPKLTIVQNSLGPQIIESSGFQNPLSVMNNENSIVVRAKSEVVEEKIIVKEDELALSPCFGSESQQQGNRFKFEEVNDQQQNQQVEKQMERQSKRSVEEIISSYRGKRLTSQ